VALYADAYPNDPIIERYMKSQHNVNRLHKSKAERDASYQEAKKVLPALRVHIHSFIQKALSSRVAKNFAVAD
jgi:hypothetical protein